MHLLIFGIFIRKLYVLICKSVCHVLVAILKVRKTLHTSISFLVIFYKNKRIAKYNTNNINIQYRSTQR